MSYAFELSGSESPCPETECCRCVATAEWSVIEYIIFCHIIWWAVYWYLTLVTRQSGEWCCRVLTFFHGCFVSYLALSDILCAEELFDWHNHPLSDGQKSYLSFMLSYFIFDFFWIHVFGNETWVIYIHHICSILIIMKIMINDFGGVGISYGAAGLEFTNPYLQLRWFLRTYGYLNTPAHTIAELSFFVLFFLIRILGGTVLLYYMVTKLETDTGMKLSLISIYAVSLVLAWKILVYFRKKYWQNRRQVTFHPSNVSISPYFERGTYADADYHDSHIIPPNTSAYVTSTTSAHVPSSTHSTTGEPSEKTKRETDEPQERCDENEIDLGEDIGSPIEIKNN